MQLDRGGVRLTDVADFPKRRRQAEGVDERAERGDPALEGQTLGSVLERQDLGRVKTPVWSA